MPGQKLNVPDDERVSYDDETGAVRSFFGAELVEAPKALERSASPHVTKEEAAGSKTDAFLEANRQLFRLDNISLEMSDVREGSATNAVQYSQLHDGVPVYGAELTVGMRKSDGRVISAVNKIDYRVPDAARAGSARLTPEEVVRRVHGLFGASVKKIEVGEPELFWYRHPAEKQDPPPHGPGPFWIEVMALAEGLPGNLYLAWRVRVDTYDPDGNWSLMIDAASGQVVAVRDRRSYASRKAYVFLPDPVTSSQRDDLSWVTGSDVLDAQRVEVTLEDLDDPAADGKCRLSGKWVKCVDKEKANFAPPESAGDFMFGSKDREFLFTMAYYWATQLVKYLRGFNVKRFNERAETPFVLDAVGRETTDAAGNPVKADNSVFTTDVSGKPYIAFGEGGVPDASDAHVIVHEYGHAMHYFLGSRQGGYEEGFNDFLAGAWLDRFNKKQFQRENVFPWDNNKAISWDKKRRLNLSEKFSDQGFDDYGKYLKGNILATALWDLFLSIGGGEADAAKRAAAADAVIHMYMEMLLLVSSSATPQQLANGLIEADKSIHGTPASPGGKYKQQIWDAFKTRGLWAGEAPGGKTDGAEIAAETAAETASNFAPEAAFHPYPPLPWEGCEVEGEIEIRVRFRTRD